MQRSKVQLQFYETKLVQQRRFLKKCFGCLVALGGAGNHCAAAFPAAAAKNNGRDLLEMGIYLDRFLQVQMASVSEKRMNKRRMLTRPQRNCRLTLAAILSRRP
jgi:hypothetical protein